MKGFLYLEDGTIFTGNMIGAKGTTVGELVFNTAMTGYQEIMTDPSYAGQIVCMTYPLIGNYGTNTFFSESAGAFLKGFICKNLSFHPSNWLSKESLEEFMIQNDVRGISGIDTRKLTKIIRKVAGIKALITSEELSKEEIAAQIQAFSMPKDIVKLVSCTEKNTFNPNANGKHIAMLDFGEKKSILKSLLKRDCKVTVYPWDTKAEEILSDNPDGILLSNGPGDPADLTVVVTEIKKLVGKRPIFGICMGNQLIARTFGAETYKLKFGHHGANHGVKDLQTGKCYITSQNHEFAVDPKTLEGTGLTISMINLNDQTVEGLRHESLPIWSVQFHPEASPGPHDALPLFDQFIQSLV